MHFCLSFTPVFNTNPNQFPFYKSNAFNYNRLQNYFDQFKIGTVVNKLLLMVHCKQNIWSRSSSMVKTSSAKMSLYFFSLKYLCQKSIKGRARPLFKVPLKTCFIHQSFDEWHEEIFQEIKLWMKLEDSNLHLRTCDCSYKLFIV